MSGGHDYQGISASDHARIINGNTYNNYHNLHKPKPPDDGSYQQGLLQAAQVGALKRVIRYLKFDIQVDFADDEGRTALHFAVKQGHQSIVRHLIEAHCNIDHRSEEHGTPLCQAILSNDMTISRLLLDQGANADAASGQHGSALHLACCMGNLGMVRLLLEHEAFVDTVRVKLAWDDAPGSSQCWRTAGTSLVEAVWLNYTKIVAALLSAGADVHALYVRSKGPFPAGSEKWSRLPKDIEYIQQPIHIAAHAGSLASLKILIKAGADVNSTSGAPFLRNPMHEAAVKGSADCIRVLVAHGASVNIQSESGAFPLHAAARGGHSACLEVLVDSGVAVNFVGADGETALMLAVRASHAHCAEFLLAQGANISQQDPYGEIALHHAGDAACVNLLVRHGADLNLRNKAGGTPLMSCVFFSRVTAVEALLDLGARIHDRGNNGWDALAVAKAYRRYEMVEILEDRGARRKNLT